MRIVEEPHGRVLVVTASGRLDGNSSGAFAEKIEPLIAGREPRLCWTSRASTSSPATSAILVVIIRESG